MILKFKVEQPQTKKEKKWRGYYKSNTKTELNTAKQCQLPQ